MRLISAFAVVVAVSSVGAFFSPKLSPKVTGALDEQGYMVFPKASDTSAFDNCYREELGATGDILRTRDTIDVLFGDADSAKEYAVEYALASSPEVILHVPAEVFKSRHDRITDKCTP